MNNMHILALLASSHCFMEALFQRRSKSENGVAPHAMLPEWQITPVQERESRRVAIFQHRRRFFRFTPRKGHVFVATRGCFDMLSVSTPEQGFTQVRQGSKIQKYPWPLTLTVWTCLNRILAHGDAMAKYVNGSTPFTLHIDNAVVMWCRWYSFNLRWSVAAARWAFNHPRIHNRPNLPIRKHFGLWNTSNLSYSTQLKLSYRWRASVNMTRSLGSFAGASKVLYPFLLGYTKVPYLKLLLGVYHAYAA